MSGVQNPKQTLPAKPATSILFLTLAACCVWGQRIPRNTALVRPPEAVAIFDQTRAAPARGQQRTQGDSSSPAYLDPEIPIEKRVEDLVSRMTLEEKISQMVDRAPSIDRLGVPAYNWWNEALHGVARAGIATVFPQAIGLAASWDTDLIYRMADVISTEARAKYNDAIAHGNRSRYYGLTFWSPNINIFRDPRWGRGQETFGEDPFLAGRIGVAFVTGLQGDHPRYLKAVSTPKHYAVHSGPEVLRHTFNAAVSMHDLMDTYTPAFRATITEGHAASIMCAYNSVSGQPACANDTLEGLLRKRWGFEGYAVSDCGAIADIYAGHRYVLTIDQAASMAVKTGTDLSCGAEYTYLVAAVRNRLISEREIHRSVARLFQARFRLGMFDPPERVPYAKIPISENDSPAHRELALRAARESIVLLKNDHNILPLKSNVKTIAVIGPNADSIDVLLGNYYGTPSKATTVLEGIRKQFGSRAKVLYAPGSLLTETSSTVVPADVLTTSGPQGSSSGLRGEYFDNLSFEGAPVLERIDANVDFMGNVRASLGNINREVVSVRWTGQLVPKLDGDYRLGATLRGEIRLHLDGKLLIDWTRGRARTATVPVTLKAGHRYDLTLEYRQQISDGVVKLVWSPPGLLPETLAVANKADVIIAVLGISPQLEGEEMDINAPGFFGGDRVDLGLPQVQQDLLHQLVTTGKPVVVVLMNGSALAVNWAQQHAWAILDAWYPGEEGGTAVAETLGGENNPAGRLPITFYTSLAQLPPFTDYSMQGRTYRYFSGEPLYSFGYGLSYSRFQYTNLRLSAAQISPHQNLLVQATLQNVSDRNGDEVVELYLSYDSDSPLFPIRSLAGFKRLRLGPGEKRQVEFTLTPKELSTVDAAGKRFVQPGNYTISVGGQQPDRGGIAVREAKVVEARFSIVGQAVELTD